MPTINDPFLTQLQSLFDAGGFYSPPDRNSSDPAQLTDNQLSDKPVQSAIKAVDPFSQAGGLGAGNIPASKSKRKPANRDPLYNIASKPYELPGQGLTLSGRGSGSLAYEAMQNQLLTRYNDAVGSGGKAAAATAEGMRAATIALSKAQADSQAAATTAETARENAATTAETARENAALTAETLRENAARTAAIPPSTTPPPTSPPTTRTTTTPPPTTTTTPHSVVTGGPPEPIPTAWQIGEGVIYPINSAALSDWNQQFALQYNIAQMPEFWRGILNFGLTPEQSLASIEKWGAYQPSQENRDSPLPIGISAGASVGLSVFLKDKGKNISPEQAALLLAEHSVGNLGAGWNQSEQTPFFEPYTYDTATQYLLPSDQNISLKDAARLESQYNPNYRLNGNSDMIPPGLAWQDAANINFDQALKYGLADKLGSPDIQLIHSEGGGGGGGSSGISGFTSAIAPVVSGVERILGFSGTGPLNWITSGIFPEGLGFLGEIFSFGLSAIMPFIGGLFGGGGATPRPQAPYPYGESYIHDYTPQQPG